MPEEVLNDPRFNLMLCFTLSVWIATLAALAIGCYLAGRRKDS